MSYPIHARVATFTGRTRGWCGDPGRRVFKERTRADGQIVFACGRGLDDEHKASGEQYPWVTMKSLRTREAAHVTCPECAAWLRFRCYVYAPPEPESERAKRHELHDAMMERVRENTATSEEEQR